MAVLISLAALALLAAVVWLILGSPLVSREADLAALARARRSREGRW